MPNPITELHTIKTNVRGVHIESMVGDAQWLVHQIWDLKVETWALAGTPMLCS